MLDNETCVRIKSFTRPLNHARRVVSLRLKTSGSVSAATDGRFVAEYSKYQAFANPIVFPEPFATSISALSGYNARNSISIIPASLFAPLLSEVRGAERALMIAEELRGPMYERGGIESPRRRPIGDRPPRHSTRELAKSDPEARRQAIERRQGGHHKLVVAFRDTCRRNKIDVDCTQYADALAAGWIFEMKTIQDDAVAQVRCALGQLYHYLFLHRHLPGYDEASLCIVLDSIIDPELAFFLVAIANVSVVYKTDSGFNAMGPVLEELPWLFA